MAALWDSLRDVEKGNQDKITHLVLTCESIIGKDTPKYVSSTESESEK